MTDLEISELVSTNLRVVLKIAREYLGRGLSWEELVAEGNYGMLLAAHRFDPARGVKFTTYSAWWIRQAIRRALLEQTQAVRVPFQTRIKLLRLQRAADRLRERLGREPDDAELGAELGINARTVTELKRVGYVSVNSLNVEIPGRDDSGELIELLADGEEQAPDLTLSRNEELAYLLKLMERLPAREARVLEQRFGLNGREARTLKEVGSELGLTVERVRQLQNQALARLFAMMNPEETTR